MIYLRMIKNKSQIKKQSMLFLLLWLLIFTNSRGDIQKKMVYVDGGSFEMGDIFQEGLEQEKPVHKVKLSGFYLSRYEVTVGEFRRFIKETGYITNAEKNRNRQLRDKYETKLKEEKISPRERYDLLLKILSLGGCNCFDTDKNTWDLKHDANWKKPYFRQSDQDPVTCISWQDAIHYCNWLSKKEKLPVAYDIKTGNLLDEKGNFTTDIVRVRGYRLPSEAEWEYAARERGKKKRFGNGKNIAKSSEINFNASAKKFPFMEKGIYRKKTTPVGSFKPNKLGLYDMSGNVWEWCCDLAGKYSQEKKTDPLSMEGVYRVARGGRWGGMAIELRTTARFGWHATNRCNNIGFRVARSK
jgi:formylglycine-generating enzyme required for sulfatase activity